MKKVIFVVGPTAAGKSKLALNLAQKFGGSIINCDSVQFYDRLIVGSASPSIEEKNSVPHYLYNYISPPQEMTAGEFQREFYRLIEQTPELKFPLWITGGTGFYIQALEKGMFNIPEIDPMLKNEIENEIAEFGNEKAYQELIAFDPESKIHINDAYRIGRALEVKRQFGIKLSEISQLDQNANKNQLPFPYIKIGAAIEDKETHRNLVITRTEQMVKQGMIEETQSLIADGFEHWAPLGSVGYKECVRFVKNEITHEALVSEIINSTMKLIKKQKTWFKRDSDIIWNGHELVIQKFIQS